MLSISNFASEAARQARSAAEAVDRLKRTGDGDHPAGPLTVTISSTPLDPAAAPRPRPGGGFPFGAETDGSTSRADGRVVEKTGEAKPLPEEKKKGLLARIVSAAVAPKSKYGKLGETLGEIVLFAKNIAARVKLFGAEVSADAGVEARARGFGKLDTDGAMLGAEAEYRIRMLRLAAATEHTTPVAIEGLPATEGLLLRGDHAATIDNGHVDEQRIHGELRAESLTAKVAHEWFRGLRVGELELNSELEIGRVGKRPEYYDFDPKTGLKRVPEGTEDEFVPIAELGRLHGYGATEAGISGSEGVEAGIAPPHVAAWARASGGVGAKYGLEYFTPTARLGFLHTGAMASVEGSAFAGYMHEAKASIGVKDFRPTVDAGVELFEGARATIGGHGGIVVNDREIVGGGAHASAWAGIGLVAKVEGGFDEKWRFKAGYEYGAAMGYGWGVGGEVSVNPIGAAIEIVEEVAPRVQQVIDANRPAEDSPAA